MKLVQEKEERERLEWESTSWIIKGLYYTWQYIKKIDNYLYYQVFIPYCVKYAGIKVRKRCSLFRKRKRKKHLKKKYVKKSKC